MVFNPKKWLSNYIRNKKPLSIVSDIVFIILVILLLIPQSRKEVAGLLIRIVSMPPATLQEDEQFYLSPQTLSWSFYDMKGTPISFASLDDKPVFLNIWASWCPPCVGELPSIKSLHQKYGDRVHFVLLSNEEPEVIDQFSSRHNYDMLPFYYYRTIPSDFSSPSIPATFIINRDHKVLVNKKGAADWDSDRVEKLLDSMLSP